MCKSNYCLFILIIIKYIYIYIQKGVSKINIKGGDNGDDDEEEGDEEEYDEDDMFANLPKDVVNRIRTIR